jgi:glycosyltransferase involved in cell wall biosynthesis
MTTTNGAFHLVADIKWANQQAKEIAQLDEPLAGKYLSEKGYQFLHIQIIAFDSAKISKESLSLQKIMKMRFSIIIPVYNRPQEVDELLESLCEQTFKDFEVVVVEDGSSEKCDAICEKYADRLALSYHFKPNSGPGPSRNYGAERSQGEYLIILDSDVIVPENYLEIIEEELDREPCDAFGGPDRAHESFTPIQKAINYAMTSFFTTGGIRGGKKKLDKFYPRSFNLGIKKSIYEALGGFAPMRYGEDIDLSTRIFKGGYSCRLFPEAFVYHKRRVKFSSFFRQVKRSGEARVDLKKKYPETFKLVHLLPAAFVVGNLLLVMLGIFHHWLWLIPIALYVVMVFIDSLIKNKDLNVALLSVPAAYCQLFGYGTGFIGAAFREIIGKKQPSQGEKS